MNAYVIRKALIRKHYLSSTIFAWVTKHPDSPLKKHFKPAVEFELDYAEFLDDALVEAFELRAACDRNSTKAPQDREWWILKPGMSDRGQGIRLFSTENELQEIFEGWEADASDSEDEVEESSDRSMGEQTSNMNKNDDYIVTSHLRHFIAQPYIHPPLLIPAPPFNSRKFHIRTYVVAVGALKVYVYTHMLALFASEPYAPPWEASGSDVSLSSDAGELLKRMKNVHLTNTCVQTARNNATAAKGAEDEPPDSVFLLSSLPLPEETHAEIQTQICMATAEVFRAALTHPINFQPLPQAFEIFGLDFLVESQSSSSIIHADQSPIKPGVNVQLLEVNAFPDFAQTGEHLKDTVVQGLFEEVFRRVVAPHFGTTLKSTVGTVSSMPRLVKVLDADMGRR